MVLSNGREREFDLVVLATGFTNLVDSIRNILEPMLPSDADPFGV